jgi:hypothetical protein
MYGRFLGTILFIVLSLPAFANHVGDEKPLFTICGKIAKTGDVVVTPADFAKIGSFEINTVVDTMSEGIHRVKGVLGRELLRQYGSTGTTLRVIGLDGYTIDVPVADLMKYDVVLANEIDGKPLSVRDKGPAWLIYPQSQHPELDDPIYAARAVWQVTRIEVN